MGHRTEVEILQKNIVNLFLNNKLNDGDLWWWWWWWCSCWRQLGAWIWYEGVADRFYSTL